MTIQCQRNRCSSRCPCWVPREIFEHMGPIVFRYVKINQELQISRIDHGLNLGLQGSPTEKITVLRWIHNTGFQPTKRCTKRCGSTKGHSFIVMIGSSSSLYPVHKGICSHWISHCKASAFRIAELWTRASLCPGLAVWTSCGWHWLAQIWRW